MLARSSGGFLRSVVILVSGTAFSQGISLALLPILTRLYAVEDFSILAVYTSLLGILSVIACARLEIAVPLPQSEEDAFHLLIASLGASVLTAVLLGIAVLTSADFIAALLKQPDILPYLWLIPMGVWLTSSFAAIQSWAARRKQFRAIAIVKVKQALFAGAVQLFFGIFLSPSALGLLLGQVINTGSGAIGLGFRTLREEWKTLVHGFTLKNLKQQLGTYSKFPKYSIVESLANSAGTQIPIIIIAAVALPEAGFVFLATRLIAAPMALIGNSTAQVYLSQAADEYRVGNLGPFSLSVVKGLYRLGSGPLIFAACAAPYVVPLIFGPEWRRAGVVTSWMIGWFIIQFMANPISMALHITGHQRFAAVLQLFGFFIRTVIVVCAWKFFPHQISEAYAVSGLIFSVVYLLVTLRIIRISFLDFGIQIIANSKSTVIWAVAGIGLIFTMWMFGI